MVAVHFRIFRQELSHVSDFVPSKTPELGSKLDRSSSQSCHFFFQITHFFIFQFYGLIFNLSFRLPTVAKSNFIILSRGCHFILPIEDQQYFYIMQQSEMKCGICYPHAFQIFFISALYLLPYSLYIHCIQQHCPKKNCKNATGII